MRLFRYLFLSAAVLAPNIAAQTPTEATFSIVATPDFDGNDGSPERPFRGSALELFLDIQDTTPTAYTWGGYQAFRLGGTGTLCAGNFQFFSTENRLFGLKHPRVANGTVVVRVTGFAREAGFELQPVQADFSITQHPFGCDGSPPPPGGDPVINSFGANNSTNTANTGGTIRLSARATDNDASLTFFFFRITTSTPIATVTGNGCNIGCTVNLDLPAPLSPTTQLFVVEVQDSEGNTVSSSINVNIVQQGGGGENPPQQCNPGQSVSQTCGGTQVSVNAGCADPVLGGEPISLDGSVSGAIGGAVVPAIVLWAVTDADGLPLSDLVIQNPSSAQTTLSTPDVNTDRTITLRLRGTVEGCIAEDTFQVTLLADPPPGADISVSLADSPDPVSVGEEVAYTMTVANNGPDAAPNVQAQFNLSGAGTIVSSEPSSDCTAVASTVTCNFGTLQNGQSRVATIVVRATSAGTLNGSASANSGADETSPGNNNASVTTTAAAATVDLSILKSGPQGQQPLGAEIEYVLALSNSGPDEAVNVQVTDVLPSQVSAVAPVVTTQGNCTVNGQVVSCSLGNLPAQGQAQITIRVTTDSPGVFSNTASVSSSTADGNSANNSSSVTTEVTDAEANLSVTAAAEGPEMGGQGGAGQATFDTFLAQGTVNGVVRVMQGAQVSYLIEVTNNGPDDATNVVVTDALPENMDITSAVSDQGSCGIVAATVSCSLGRLDFGESALIRIDVQANAEAQVINTVSVQASQIDPQPDDNQADVEVRIRSLPGLFATTHADNLASLDAQLASVFVGLALHNPIGDENRINIQGLTEEGEVVADFDQDDPVQPLGQQAVLTRQLVDADTILAEGLKGPVQGFFMIGDVDGQGVLFLDGIGNRLEESVCSEEIPPACLTFLPQAREVDDDLTIVFLFNPDLTEAATFTATLFDVNGAQIAEVTDTLEPSGSVLATLRQLFGEEQGVIEDGFIQVQSDLPLRGFEAVIEDGTLISIPAMRGLLSRKLSVPHFAIGRTLSTPIRILNVGAGEVTATVRATFDDASEGTMEAEFMIPPGQVRTIDLSTALGLDIDSLPSNRLLQGFLELELVGGILGPFDALPDVVPIVTFDEEVQKTRSSLPMVSGEGERETLFLQVAHTRRPGGFFQGLAVFNPQLEAVQVTVQAYRGNGQLRAESVVTIGPRSRVVGLLAEFLGDAFEQSGGYLRLSSDSPVIAFSLFGGPRFLSAVGGQTPLN